MKLYEGDQRVLGFILEDKAKLLRDKVFLYYKDEKITYEEMNEKTRRIANTLIKELGIKGGHKVAALLPNCPEFVFLHYAIAKTGAIQVPINPEAKGHLLAHLINNSDSQVLIIDQQFVPNVKDIEHNLEKLQRLIIRRTEPGQEVLTFDKKFEIGFYEDLLRGSTELPQVRVRRVDPSAIFYTSGTTGPAKGVVLPHNHNYDIAVKMAQMGRFTPEDISYVCLPYYHGSGQYFGSLVAMVGEGSMVLAERFSASRFWEEIRKYNATHTFTIYTIPSILMKQSERPDDADNPLRVVWGAGILPEIHEAFERRFNLKFIDMYGSTEQGTIAYTPYEERRIGAVGPINEQDYEVAIVDDEDEVLPQGKVGEIVSRPKKPYLRMMEYYNMPEATLEAYRNLWLHSGDLGFIDEDGWLHFVGRKKDAIRRKGENIAAYEFEGVVVNHPSVKECAAIPVPAEIGEDEVKVVVVLKKGVKLTPQELIVFCQEKMPRYMVPRYVEFRESLPKTATEKVEKVKLKQEGLTADTWDKDRGDYIKNLR
jgi:crotonobetaine/carnitine-CoA ligase